MGKRLQAEYVRGTVPAHLRAGTVGDTRIADREESLEALLRYEQLFSRPPAPSRLREAESAERIRLGSFVTLKEHALVTSTDPRCC
jgi:hypothetical protein